MPRPCETRWLLPRLVLSVFVLGSLLGLLAQQGPADPEDDRKAPRPREDALDRSPESVAAGRALFLERCAVCHGQNATGGMAASLVRSRLVAQGKASDLFQVIRKGIPGTEMPPQDLPDENIWEAVSYLHSLTRPGAQPPVDGDVVHGREVFVRACSGCHAVSGQGGFYGPDLSSIAARKSPEAIRDDLLNPSAKVATGYHAVSVTTKQGKPIEGLLKNEDMFSLQILTKSGDYALLHRDEILRMELSDSSAMPGGWEQRLKPKELQDLLAFLDRRRDSFVVIDKGFQNY